MRSGPVITRALTRAGNLLSELRLGVRTSGTVEAQHDDAVYYAATGYRDIRTILSQLALRPDDVFVDIGCGKGRVLCCAARLELTRVIGVEISQQLCTIARGNAASMRGQRTRIEVHTTPAQHFDYSRASVLFLFNPFLADTLSQVLAKVRADLAGRPVRIAYAVPTFHHVFDAQDWLERYEPPGGSELALFYRTRPAG
jgi:cyclopropane fatty-acyl-phospholipid synthase-like methyltransferase